MLPTWHRLRTGAEFSRAFRSGVRSGRRNVVLYTAENTEKTTQIGFIVSKAVGNAITRNSVKRRLRVFAASTVAQHPTGLLIAVRALPAAAHASTEQLREDYEQALASCLAKLQARQSREESQGADTSVPAESSAS